METENVFIVCKCGERIGISSQGFSYRYITKEGEVLYEVCIHGIVVIDKYDEMISAFT